MLARAGIVSRDKQGTSVRCTIADESVFNLCEQVCGDLSNQLDELRALLDGQEVTS